MKIGYCPTMKFFVDKLSIDEKIEKIDLGSAKAVLAALSNEDIDVGIIGRTAKKTEFTGFKRRIENGYTLITNKKQMILNDNLPQIKINTAISESIINTKFPYLKNVVYHKTINNKLSDSDVWLISWDDWKDEFELLIPIDEQYNKNPDFRVPHLFSKKEDHLIKLLQTIK